MKTHAGANNKIGLTIIVLVAFQMLVRTLSGQVAGLVDEIITKIAGGDLALIKISSGFKQGMDLDSLDRNSMTSMINEYKSKYGLI